MACIEKVYSDTKMTILDNVLTRAECDALIQCIDSSQSFQVKSGGRQVTRTDLPELSQVLGDRCRLYIPPYVYRHSRLSLSPDPHNTDYLYWLSPEIDSRWSFAKGGSLSMHLDAATIRSVDCVSFYTVLCYLNDNDGATVFEYGGRVLPKTGRVAIFDQRLLHQGTSATTTKYVARSQILYMRSTPLKTSQDQEAVDLFNAGDKDRAFELSPVLEEIVLEF